MQKMPRNNTLLWKHGSMKLLECYHFSLMISEGKVKTPYMFSKHGEPCASHSQVPSDSIISQQD